MLGMTGDQLARAGVRRRGALVAAVCAMGIALVACGGDARTAETAAPTEAPSVSGPNDEGADVAAPEPYPTWNAEARDAARVAARKAMSRFARPDLDENAWWSELVPLLSPMASVAYVNTDPATVPVRDVTGAAELVDASSPYLAKVRVPTDAGHYVVLLSRAGQGSPWLVERFTPPRALRTP